MTKNDCQYIRGLVRTKQNVPGSFQQRAVDNHFAKCEDCRRYFRENPEYMLAAQLGVELPLLDATTLRSRRMAQRRRTMEKGLKRLSNEKRATLIKRSKPMRKMSAKPYKQQKKKGRKAKSRKTLTNTQQILQSLYYTGIGVVIAFIVYYGVQTSARFSSLARIYQNLGIISVVESPTPTEPFASISSDNPTPSMPQPTTVPEPDIASIAIGEDRAITILLLGTDRRPQESAPSRSDTIMLMRVFPDAQYISLLSLPRDLMVDIPGYGVARINAAHVYGDLYRSLGSGMSLATQTVSNVIGEPIDYTVVVDFQGFISAIDTLGGVPVSISKSLYDANFPTMDYGYKEVSFAPGTLMMDGDTALTYSRIRHPDNDFERMGRQQAVLVGILQRLQQGGFLAQVDATADITDALVRHARTDAPRDAIIAMAWHMRNTPADNIRHVVFRDVYYGSGSDQYAMFPVDGALARSVTEWMKSP